MFLTVPGSFVRSNLPVGFVLNEKAYQITIREDGDVVEIKLENRYIRGDIEGLKLDEDGKVIAGAKFGLFKPGTTEFTEENAVLVTESDAEGKFRFEDIRFGKWIVRELVPATGYVLNETPIEVNIQTEGEVINISFENKFIRSDIKGYKVDEDGKPVEGALFGLFTEDGNPNSPRRELCSQPSLMQKAFSSSMTFVSVNGS